MALFGLIGGSGRKRDKKGRFAKGSVKKFDKKNPTAYNPINDYFMPHDRLADKERLTTAEKQQLAALDAQYAVWSKYDDDRRGLTGLDHEERMDRFARDSAERARAARERKSDKEQIQRLRETRERIAHLLD